MTSGEMRMTAEKDQTYTHSIVDFVVGTKFNHLPSDVVTQAKRIILDTLGCGIGGYTLDRGRTFDAASDYAKGDPWTKGTRMSDEELKDKFRSFSNKTLRSTRIEEAIEKVFGLEKLDRISKLTELLIA
jgi:2-methylcitrate dehydratase PrpD